MKKFTLNEIDEFVESASLKSEARHKRALAFLEQCKGEDLSVIEVERTVDEIISILKNETKLNSGMSSK